MTTTKKAEPMTLAGKIDAMAGDPLDPIEDEMEIPVLSCAERILMVMGEVGNIPKTDWNDGQKFYYRSVERVIAATRDAMIKYRLLCVPHSTHATADTREGVNRKNEPTVTRTATLKIVYHFVNVDDPEDVVEAEVVSEANDSGDKAMSKAMTAAHKAVMLQAFQIGDNGSDQDNGGEEPQSEPEWASESDVEIIKTLIAALDEQATKILRAAWTPRWGSVARGRIPLDVLDEIGGLLAALAVPDVPVSGE